jgi:hypothetical protein
MKYALVIADVPVLDLVKGVDTQHKNVAQFEDNISNVSTKDAQIVKRLGLGVYLIPLEKTLPLLTDVLYNAKRLNVSLRVLFLDEEPLWVTS